MDDKVKTLVQRAINVEDFGGVFSDLIEREDIDPNGHDDCDVSGCGSSWCRECGCLVYKQARLASLVEAATTLWPEAADTPTV